VLERSVNIRGADYLVQMRLTETKFLDQEPPSSGNRGWSVKQVFVADLGVPATPMGFELALSGKMRPWL
jgi:hypothetical protein